MGLEFANKFKNMGLISEETAEEARIENENMQNQNRHNKHSKNNNKKQNTNNKYVGAPYNFVPFYNDVVGVDEDNLKVHDKIRDNLISGEISYTVKAETPIFISDGNKDNPNFVKNERGEYIIPGSTMRGLIRNNVQILGLSSFDDDINDYNLMYRDVTGGIDKENYKELLGAKQISIGNGKKISILSNVKAGYIGKKAGKYIIYKTKVDKIKKEYQEMNYYALSERNINENIDSFPYIKKNNNCQQNILKGKKDDFIKNVIKGRTHYIGKENKQYDPGFRRISYELADLNKIVCIDDEGKCSNDGYLVSSGQIREKKAHYVIPAIDKTKDAIEISNADINAYKIDFEKKKNILGKNAGYFKLPEENEIKPVFYIVGKNNKLYFGFTPSLRLFYDYNIKHGFKQKNKEFDYTKSIFGVSNKDFSYKSKVSFADCIIENKDILEDRKVILAEPKPSSFMDYLVQNNNKITYNSDNFELRGVKQYWLHSNPVESNNSNNTNIGSSIVPMNSGTEFKGKIRFQNMTKDELGLLLWSIKLEANSWMNIGMGKPYGYGAISIKNLNVKILDNKEAYRIDNNKINFNPYENIDIKEYINCYIETIKKKINGRDIHELETVKVFFAMKNSNNMPDIEKIRYMSIDKKEYQNRKPLKSAMETLK